MHHPEPTEAPAAATPGPDPANLDDELEVPDVDDLVLAELLVWRDQVIATGYELVTVCMDALDRFEAVQIPPTPPSVGGAPGPAEPVPDDPALVRSTALPPGPLNGLDRLAAIDAIRIHLGARFPDRPRLRLAYVRGYLRRSRQDVRPGPFGVGLAVATDDELRGMLAELEALEATIGSPA